MVVVDAAALFSSNRKYDLNVPLLLESFSKRRIVPFIHWVCVLLLRFFFIVGSFSSRGIIIVRASKRDLGWMDAPFRISRVKS